MPELGRFTYDEYRDLLGRVAAGRVGLCFADFREPVRAERFFLLRHDVDSSPAGALELARIEADLGIRATYFFLLTGERYNLLSGRCVSVPRRIVELGHEVGLHYDVGLIEAGGGDPLDMLRREAEMLGGLTGRAVQSIAMHNPSLGGRDPFRDDATFINAYDEAFTAEIAYFSDSCGAWRDRAYESLTGGEIPPRLQLLIHPMLWGPTPADRWGRLDDWADAQKELLRADVEEMKRIWRNHTGVAEHDRRS